MEKPYRDMKKTMLKWNFCRGFVFSPTSLALQIRGSYIQHQLVLQTINDLKPLLLTRLEASKQLSGEKSEQESDDHLTDTRKLKVSARMDALESKFDKTQEILETILKSVTNNRSEQEEEEDFLYSDRSEYESDGVNYDNMG
ncbi:unnamed protein product [Psylliodes chrysocephalus]|uniref:Uncharacterized protein n=1 Tax=Psylliodes chrysocephalus TaxID=3402493 RepID=A0A9P0G4C2_9CUCU|nr:unnamed protein product [Psylliodes chrysocephala]